MIIEGRMYAVAGSWDVCFSLLNVVPHVVDRQVKIRNFEFQPTDNFY